MMEIFCFAFFYAVTAIVWICMMVNPGDVFDGLPVFASRFINPEGSVMRVLFQCEKCFAGQLSLWTYPMFIIYFQVEYSTLKHILVILLSIFFAGIIGKIYNRL